MGYLIRSTLENVDWRWGWRDKYGVDRVTVAAVTTGLDTDNRQTWINARARYAKDFRRAIDSPLQILGGQGILVAAGILAQPNLGSLRANLVATVVPTPTDYVGLARYFRAIWYVDPVASGNMVVTFLGVVKSYNYVTVTADLPR